MPPPKKKVVKVGALCKVVLGMISPTLDQTNIARGSLLTVSILGEQPFGEHL